MNNQSLEQAAAAVADPTARRVTLDYIESRIKDTRYYVDGTLTIAVVEHQNGFKAVGTSAAADPRNYNRELGEKAARARAIEDIWKVEGFLVRVEIANALTLRTIEPLWAKLHGLGYSLGKTMTAPVELINPESPKQYVVEARTARVQTDEELLAIFEEFRGRTIHLYQVIDDDSTVKVRFGVKPI